MEAVTKARYSLLHESVQLIRDGKCQPIRPLERFELSKAKEAFRFFGGPSRLGKVVIDLISSNPGSKLEVDLW